MPARILTSANVVLYINGGHVGRVSGFSFSSSTNHNPIYGLDNSEALELAPGTTTCSGSISVFRTIGDGGAEGLGVATRFQDLIREKYFTMQLIERTSGTTIFQATRAKLSGQQWSVEAPGVMRGHLNFIAIDWSNEVAPAAQEPGGGEDLVGQALDGVGLGQVLPS